MTETRWAGLLLRIRRSAAPPEGELSDGELLRRFADSGDAASFELIVWRHQHLVFGVCRRVLGDHHDAEDALQATFLVLARKARSIGKREALAGWLYGVAYRVAVAARRNRTRRRLRQRPLAAAAAVTLPDFPVPAERDEFWSAVDAEVSQLPAPFRAATVLCYLQGKSVDEAARQLGCPRGTVASRLARARERLRGRLSRRGITLTTGAVAAALTESAASALAPERLVHAIVRAVTSSHLSGPGVSAPVAALTQEVLRMMLIKKMVTSVVFVLALASTFLLGAGFAVRLYAGDRTEGQGAEQGSALTGPAVDQEEKAPPDPLPVSVVRPLRREYTPHQTFEGRLAEAEAVSVPFPGDRYLVRMALDKPSVKKGEPLFGLPSKDDEQKMLLLTREVDRLSEYAYQSSENALEARKLFALGKLAESQLDLAAKGLATAEAALKKAKENFDQAEKTLLTTKVVAPVSGRIVAKDNSCIRLLPDDTIGLVFKMDERAYVRFRGQLAADKRQAEGAELPVQLVDQQGFPEKAILKHFESEFDSVDHRIWVHCALADPERLRLPGMVAQVRVPLGKPRSALEVPTGALRTGDSPARVWVVNQQNIVEERLVKLGPDDDDMRVVEEGLQPDDQVIVGVLPRLQPGVAVAPRLQAPRE